MLDAGDVVQGMGISVGQRWCGWCTVWMGSQAALPHMSRSRKVWKEIPGDDAGVGIKTRYSPFIMSSLGSFGPAASAFPSEVYKAALKKGRWLMLHQPSVVLLWSTSFASTYWEMRLSSACMAMDSYCQQRIVARDRNAPLLPIPVARQAFADASRAGYNPPIGSVAKAGSLR